MVLCFMDLCLQGIFLFQVLGRKSQVVSKVKDNSEENKRAERFGSECTPGTKSGSSILWLGQGWKSGLLAFIPSSAIDLLFDLEKVTPHALIQIPICKMQIIILTNLPGSWKHLKIPTWKYYHYCIIIRWGRFLISHIHTCKKVTQDSA